MLDFLAIGENMTVYIEYVIINNLIIDYLLLKATFVFTGNSYLGRRLFLCAFLGAVISLVYPLVDTNSIILICLKIMSGLLILLLANSYKNLNQFFRCSVVFFLLTFLSGGVIIGMYNLLGISLGTESVVASVLVPIYFLVKLVKKTFCYLSKRINVEKFSYQVELYYKDKKTKAKAFLDTGNNLYDGENAVILCSSDFIKDFLGDEIATVKLKKLKLTTVAGERENLSFRLDKFILYLGQKEHIFNYITVCIANLSLADYDIILHPALLKEQGIENNQFFKEVS